VQEGLKDVHPGAKDLELGGSASGRGIFLNMMVSVLGQDQRGLGLRRAPSWRLKRRHRWRPWAVGVDLGSRLLVGPWRIRWLVVIVVGLSISSWPIILIPSARQSLPVPREKPLPEEFQGLIEHSNHENQQARKSQCHGGFSAPELEENGL